MTTAFFDIDTQIDFLYPAGALYVPGAEKIVPAVARLNQWAAAHGIPVVSTVDAHAEDDPEFKSWPPHCVAGTAPQAKPAATRLPEGQTILEKQTTDVGAAPELDEVLARLGVERAVVYGVVTEICVAAAARALLRRGKQVVVVTDAVMHLDDAGARRFYQELEAAGGTVATVAEVTG